jgi:hypothetical protein
MGKMFFGSVGKVIWWLIVLVLLIGSFSHPVCLLGVLLFLVTGPCVAIPPALALRGKHVVTSKNERELRQSVATCFTEKKVGRQWFTTHRGLGQVNYLMRITKTGDEPVVSVDFQDNGNGTTLISIWMSEWTEGGLNGGRGTPFWVWGGARALSKVNQLAKAVTA